MDEVMTIKEFLKSQPKPEKKSPVRTAPVWTDKAIADLRAVYPHEGTSGFCKMYPHIGKNSVTKMASTLGIKNKFNGRNTKTNIEARSRVREIALKMIAEGPIHPNEIARIVGCSDGIARREFQLMCHERLMVREMVASSSTNVKSSYRLPFRSVLDEIFAPLPKFSNVTVWEEVSADDYHPQSALTCAWVKSGLQSAQGMMEMAA